MDKKQIAAGAVVALVVAAGVSYLLRPAATVQVVERVVERVASVVGPESTQEERCIGTLCVFDKVGGCFTSSSTLFAFQNPWRATSTWSLAEVSIGRAPGTAAGLHVSTSTNTATGTGPGLITGVSIQGLTGIIRSGFITGTTSVNSGQGRALDMMGNAVYNPGTTTRSVMIGPDDFIVGVATGTITDIVNNTGFQCNYHLRFEKL